MNCTELTKVITDLGADEDTAVCDVTYPTPVASPTPGLCSQSWCTSAVDADLGLHDDDAEHLEREVEAREQHGAVRVDVGAAPRRDDVERRLDVAAEAEGEGERRGHLDLDAQVAAIGTGPHAGDVDLVGAVEEVGLGLVLLVSENKGA